MRLDELKGGNHARLTDDDVAGVANALNVTKAHVWAVCDVESGGKGFRDDGLPVFRFEAHIFGREKGFHYEAGNPNSVATLQTAMDLDLIAALRSTSWGLFQIMGFNSGLCGFGKDVEAMVRAHAESELRQLSALSQFLIATHLDDKLRANDWAGFAHGYNGSGYAQNAYDVKLKVAYNARAAGFDKVTDGKPRRPLLRKGSKGEDVRELQRLLNKAGGLPFPLNVDGDFGPGTEEHVVDFQNSHGLVSDGIVGNATWAALEKLT